MIARDFKSEGAEHQRRQTTADGKIADLEKRLRSQRLRAQQRIDDQQLMNEMRGNKATLDFNRAMFDYDDADEDGGRVGSRKSP